MTTPATPTPAGPTFDWPGIGLALVVGAAGGAAGAVPAHAAAGPQALIGAAFGAVVAGVLRGRVRSTGDGLIWGLAGGFLLWIAMPFAATLQPVSGSTPGGMLEDVRARFPELLLCLVGLGAPVGLALGLRGGLSRQAPPFNWGRAITAGGLSGLVAALIFSRWIYEGDFFPLIAGYGETGSHFAGVLAHFAVACLIGCSFGVIFQNDLRSLGSSLGWGMAYGMFWWFLGSMTLFPLAAGRAPEWSADRAGDLFGAMVGHIFYGLILGVVYSFANLVWTRLFVDADPLNRRREGPGIRVLRSLGWGGGAGLIGGLLTLPFMIQNGLITKLAGLDSGLPFALGIVLHLAVSTLLGASYGVLFRGESTEAVFGSLWGSLLGLVAWYAGPLTLLPLLRTGECDWRPGAAAALLPSLISHLLFGIITANVFLALERRALRHSPPAARPPEPTTDGRPAAALCVFVFGIGVLLPVLLA